MAGPDWNCTRSSVRAVVGSCTSASSESSTTRSRRDPSRTESFDRSTSEDGASGSASPGASVSAVLSGISTSSCPADSRVDSDTRSPRRRAAGSGSSESSSDSKLSCSVALLRKWRPSSSGTTGSPDSTSGSRPASSCVDNVPDRGAGARASDAPSMGRRFDGAAADFVFTDGWRRGAFPLRLGGERRPRCPLAFMAMSDIRHGLQAPCRSPRARSARFRSIVREMGSGRAPHGGRAALFATVSARGPTERGHNPRTNR